MAEVYYLDLGEDVNAKGDLKSFMSRKSIGHKSV